MSDKLVDMKENYTPVEEGLITLSTGVVLEAKQIPPGVYFRVMSINPRPEAPQYKGAAGEMYSNPDSPDHIEAVKAWEVQNQQLILNTLILYGTTLKKKPKELPGHMSDGWLENYELLGVEMRKDNKSWRYLEWILSVACASGTDFNLITREVGRLSGVPEEDVSLAEDFPASDQSNGDGGTA